MTKPSANHKSPAGNPKAASTRLQLRSARALAGQRKHDLRIGKQPDYVDGARRDLNRVLMEPAPPGAMRAVCEGRRALRDTKRKMKKDAAVAACGIITFGTEAAALFEAMTPQAQNAAFSELAEAVAERLNTTLHGLVVHMDETTIHAHFQVAAYNRDGIPLSQATRPAVMSGLQDLTAEIMARHCPGIERGNRYGDRIAAGADFRDTLHRTVRQLHNDLPAEIAAKQAELVKAAERVEEMRERVRKLEDKAALTEKEAKRLDIYRKRLDDRIAEQEAAQTEAERLAVASRAEAEDAQEARNQAKADEVAAVDRAARITSAIQVLAEEVNGETITRDEAGKIWAGNKDGLKRGFPELKPAVIKAAETMATKKRLDGEAEEYRQKAVQAWEEAKAAQQEMFSLRDIMGKMASALRGGLNNVLGIIDEEERLKAEQLLKSAEAMISPPETLEEGLGR